ncbi:DUF6904 family protein [Paenibacillus marinisediminis]
MISVVNTPHYAGVTISGDYNDLDQLYSVLHLLVDEQNLHQSYNSLRIRILALCYEVRHALMGDRSIELVDNGLHEEAMKYHAVIAPKNNVYYSFRVYWPELLFICKALDILADRLDRHKKKPLEWNLPIAVARQLQANIVNCLTQIMPAPKAARVMNSMNGYFVDLDYYTTQYLDSLNCKFLAMDAEKRLKNISVMAKRIFERGDDYKKCRQAVHEAAKEYNCPVEQIELDLEYPDPEQLDW